VPDGGVALDLETVQVYIVTHTSPTAMDIARGSRRARHVAANAAAAAADEGADNVDAGWNGRRTAAPAHAHAQAHAVTTPGTTAINSAQTPNLQHHLGSSLRSEAPPAVRRQPATLMPNYSHRTPEQVVVNQGASPPGVVAPPLHPFRLHRSEVLGIVPTVYRRLLTGSQLPSTQARDSACRMIQTSLALSRI
jgi:hypothetical protein